MLVVAAIFSLGSCKDEVDESDMFTFTGKTITSYLNENSDEYSLYSYILTKVRLSPKSKCYNFSRRLRRNVIATHKVDPFYLYLF